MSKCKCRIFILPYDPDKDQMVPDFEIGKVYNQILEFDRVPCIERSLSLVSAAIKSKGSFGSQEMKRKLLFIFGFAFLKSVITNFEVKASA